MTTALTYSPFLKTDIMEHDHRWLDRFNAIIEENLDDHTLNNKQISEAMGVSERQLFRRMEEITELTPGQYIRRYRLTKAKEFLEAGVYLTVKETSYAVGFINTGYFVRQFKTVFGKKPIEILKEYGWR